MTKVIEKDLAQALRKRGVSISEIAHKVSISKSTVSNWCRNITLTDHQIVCLTIRSKNKATPSLLQHSEKQRKKRQQEELAQAALGKKQVGTLTRRDVFMVGLGLYWGEGYKKGNQELGFTNSDPNMILFFIDWITSVFDVSLDDLIFRVSINAQHKNRLRQVERYWSELTKMPLSQFTRSSLIHAQSKKIYIDRDTHYGTLRVKVRRGTNLRRRILEGIDTLQKWPKNKA